MQFDGAVIEEQNVVFGIVIVRPHVLRDPAQQRQMQSFGARVFGAIPIVLMAQDSRGIPTYYGRSDIVDFLRGVPVEAIPWRQYTVHAA
ncbi:MAG TPA: hypothetical protein VFQ85_00600 [Mycobacteriales bacterium]|jgi:hypothetical protein|nr:hypothetical protein [Mycobacteriales bacterium]